MKSGVPCAQRILSCIVLLIVVLMIVQAFMKEGFAAAAADMSPADAQLQSSNPYHLLDNEVVPRIPPSQIGNINSCACYGADFQTRIEKTGNYRQLTNNYKREVPESCSAPRHELIGVFYEQQPF